MPLPVLFAGASGIAAGAKVAGALGTVGKVAGPMVLQNYLNKRAQDRAFEQNKAFWHERFDKEAQYNSPVQQKARLMQAGLNPAMMYGKGGTTGEVKGGSAQGKIAEQYQLQELALMSAQVAKIKSEALRNNASATLTESKIEGQQSINIKANQEAVMSRIKAEQYDKELTANLLGKVATLYTEMERYETQKAETALKTGQAISQAQMVDRYMKLYEDAVQAGIDLQASSWWQILAPLAFKIFGQNIPENPKINLNNLK